MWEEIIVILMRRDGLTRSEAESLMAETQNLVDVALASGELGAIECILEDQLGLEMDYVYAFV